jgi:beta-xylosidase
MYILCSHDLDGQDGYQMYDFTLISSDDLVNWTDHGEVISVPRDASWATLAWAPTMVYRNGYYYVYFGNGANNIGVLRSTNPAGPFTDPLGRPLITRDMPNCNVAWLFDPAVFIDDDGQAYLYFGGGGAGNARVIKLNSDMISVNGSAVTIDAPQYFEAPYMHKRKWHILFFIFFGFFSDIGTY